MHNREPILSMENARRVNYGHMLERLVDFLPKDFKRGRCDGKSIKKLDSILNYFQEAKDDVTTVSTNVIQIIVDTT